MCNKDVLNKVTEKICAASKEVLGEKLEKVILFGSYARGDYDEESDIDIMVLADIAPEDVNKTSDKIRTLMEYIDLYNDVLVTLCIECSSIYHKYLNASRFFMNVQKDGIELYAA